MDVSATSLGQDMADLADRYWRAYLEYSPVSATAYGVRDFDDRLDDLRPAARLDHRARLVGLRAEGEALRRLGPASPDLTDEERLTAPELVNQIDADIAQIDADLDRWTVDPLEGPQVQIFNIESFQTVGTPAEGEALVARWRAIGGYLDQHAANLRLGLGDGQVAVRSPVERVLDALNHLLAESDEAWTLLNPGRADHADWSPSDLTRFRAELRAAVRDVARPALRRFRDMVEREVLPVSRPDDRPGIMHVSGGAATYGSLIRLYTSLPLGAEELHRTGLAEVLRINTELEELGDRVLGTRRRPEILARLRGDPALYFTTSAEVAAKAALALDRARAAIPGWFGRLPRADCAVVEMGEHEARHGTIAYYRQPDPEGSRPGQFFINTSAPETRPRYEAEALAYHESIPGHHLQIAIAQELAELPEFRRHLGTTAFWEGWGLYSERLSDEMGLYSAELDRIGMLSLDAWRACRLVVDTGMHAFGWTRRQAIDYMVENTALAANNIENEVDRYIVWPGQALAYKTGQLEILRLRDEARDRLGPAFDIRRFHDVVLGSGAVGLGTLRTIVETRLPSR